MKRILTIAGLMMVMLLPAFAQGRRMSAEDQGKFDSYYSRWQQFAERAADYPLALEQWIFCSLRN